MSDFKKVWKIEFEGIDGSGKTTALKYFLEKAKEKGLTAIETREVGNPHVKACVELRKFVLNPENNLRGETMELLFSAMRYENDKWYQDMCFSPDAPDLLVSDRGWLSHLAYTDHNVSRAFTDVLYKELMQHSTVLPDIVIYFNVDNEVSLKRRAVRGTSDVIENKGFHFQEKVKESFAEYITTYRRHFLVLTVDANQDIPNVQQQLDVILKNILHWTKLDKKLLANE